MVHDLDQPEAGVPGAELKTEMEDLQTRKVALEHMKLTDEPGPLLHPSMAIAYRTKVEQLAAALEHDDLEQREAARSALRGFITAIVIPPGEALLQVQGDLGGMLAAAMGHIGSAAVAYVGCGGGI